MTIKSIKKDKKHLTKLFLSDGAEMLVDNDVCTERGIYEGMDVDLQLLQEIKTESDYKRAKSRALWYLDRMDYTEKALFEKLVRAGFDKKASAKVLANLVEFGMVDDRRFAQRFAERCCENNISKREATQKMLLKGVPLDLAKEVLCEIETDEEEQITNLLSKKYAYKLTQEKGTERVFAALVRKGFSFSAIKSAMKRYNDQLEFCEE